MLDAVGPAHISARLSALDQRFDQRRGPSATAKPPIVEAEVIEDHPDSQRGGAAEAESAALQISDQLIADSQRLPAAPTTYGPDAVPRFTRATTPGRLVSVRI